MRQFLRLIALAIVFSATLVLFVACGTQSESSTTPVETITLDISLQVYNWSDASVEKAAVIVNDASGNVLSYTILDNPSEDQHPMIFNNVPVNSTITIFSKSTRHLTWPTDDIYTTARFSTFDVSMIEKAGGKVYIDPSWIYLDWDNPIITKLLKLQAPCPEGASYLGSSWFNPSSGGYWIGSLECLNGIADGLLWSPVQQNDDNISAIVWSQVEDWPYYSDGYTQPLQYLRIIDHDPNNVVNITNINDYSTNITTANLTVTNLPSDASVRYDITGIRKGAPLDGLQAYSTWSSPTSTVTLANIINDLDSVIQHAKIYKRFATPTNDYIEANYTIYKFSSTNNFQLNSTWDYNDFPSAPNPSGVSLQQEERFTIRAQDFGDGNESAIYRVWTITDHPNPTYVNWYAYTILNPNDSTIEYSYPKLPNELAMYNINLNYDYISASITTRNHDLYPTQFITQGMARSLYVRKRDNITSQLSASVNARAGNSTGANINPELVEIGVDISKFPIKNY